MKTYRAMTLPEYIASGADTWHSLGERVGLTRGHICNIGVGRRECKNTIAAAIERETGGKVTQGEIAATREAWLKANQTRAA